MGTEISVKVRESPLFRIFACPMAAGRPVVGTSVAFEATDAVADQDAVVVDDPAAMAVEIDTLLTDPARSAAMGRAGRARVMARFGANAVRQDWCDLYDRLAQSRSGSVVFRSAARKG